jgi:hypothetical protein
MPPYNSPHYSRSRWSGWSGFSLRFVGSLVVFAIAALSGAVIGGVSIYLINDAATPPPSAGANSNQVLSDGATTSPSADHQATQQAGQQTPGATNGRPVRVIDPAFPPPSSAETKPAAPAATETATQPPAENSASSAAIPAQPTTSQPPAAVQPQSPPASVAASQPTPQDNARAPAPAAATLDTATHEAVTQGAATQAAAPEASEHAASPRKTAAARKRGTNARYSGLQPAPQPSDQAQSATRRTVYDYYDRDNDQQRASASEQDTTVRGQRGPSQTQRRVIVRRQDNYSRDDDRYGRDNRDDQADHRGFPAQPQPAQSFFGFFGDRHYDNDRD